MSYWQQVNLVPAWMWAALGGMFGAVIASFLGVVGERIPRHETLGGRSHCVCGVELAAGANVPILGWLMSRGRARCCGARIPVRYFWGEVGLSVAWGAAWYISPNWMVAGCMMIVSALVLLVLSWKKP